MIWEPFILALVLGIIVSAGLYFAYLWPSVEPVDDKPAPEISEPPAEISPAIAEGTGSAGTADAGKTDAAAGPDAAAGTDAPAGTDVSASPAP